MSSCIHVPRSNAQDHAIGLLDHYCTLAIVHRGWHCAFQGQGPSREVFQNAQAQKKGELGKHPGGTRLFNLVSDELLRDSMMLAAFNRRSRRTVGFIFDQTLNAAWAASAARLASSTDALLL